MADDSEIMAKIARLQGRIDARKARHGLTYRPSPHDARTRSDLLHHRDSPSPKREGNTKRMRGCYQWTRARDGKTLRQRGEISLTRKATLCRRYTSTGSCYRGHQCAGLHDVDRIALCPSVVRGRDCSAGDDCDLGHTPTPENTPTCVHYLRGACHKAPCRYAHADLEASAPLCSDFADLGYCVRGATCGGRHLRQCPEYTNHGLCANPRCSLPHVDRASQMRKKANTTGRSGHVDVDEEQASHPQGDTEAESSALDVDERNDLRGAFHLEQISGTGTREFSQQQDFVGLL